MHSVEPPLVRRYRGDRLRLGLRSLYIVPTRFGLLWLLATALLHLVAIQQRSNGTLLLSFLLLGLMLLAMHLTHDNLHGLELRCARPDPGFAAQAVTYPLRLHSRGPRQRLRLQFAGGEPLELETLPGGETAVDLAWSPQRRGLHRPGRLHIETIAPLGLFVCWGRWEPSQDQLILPARRPGPVAEQAGRFGGMAGPQAPSHRGAPGVGGLVQPGQGSSVADQAVFRSGGAASLVTTSPRGGTGAGAGALGRSHLAPAPTGGDLRPAVGRSDPGAPTGPAAS